MRNEEAQKLAPSFLRLPNDGADYRCYTCKQMKKHTQVCKPFTPDGKIHYATCFECLDSEWLSKAKDCGYATD